MSTWTEFRDSITGNLGIQEITPEQIAEKAGKETAAAIKGALSAPTNPPVTPTITDPLSFNFFKNMPVASKISAQLLIIGLGIAAYLMLGKRK
jgi:hypothetical protein